MKKLITLAAGILLAVSLVSCGKKIDSSRWLSDFDDAKKAAKTENKRLFMFFSNDEGDEKSLKLKQNVFNKEEFITNYTDKYVLLNIDFSDSRFETEQETLQKDTHTADSYSVKATPYFLVLSSDGYVVAKPVFDENADFDTVKITFNEAEEEIQKFEDSIAKTKTGTKEEKLAAIEELYNMTDEEDLYHLCPLNELYVSLDKNNESGNTLKHLIAIANKKAVDYFTAGESEKGAEEYVKLTKNKILTDDDKQMAYYSAGYFLASSGSQNLAKIREYFQKGYEINPDSEVGKQLKIFIDYVQMMIDGEGDEAAAAENPANEENPVETTTESASE
ncbi:thioredoxin family protein [Treponema sp.]|uniref:thioredoxin family protein n=1 Tax=Treponema sp. TaxID=166 RepID=UPI003890F375